jgi:8-oxo-dGTP diphosphatase
MQLQVSDFYKDQPLPNLRSTTRNHIMSTPASNPRVGVAAVLLNAKGELVLGKRAGSHGSGKLITTIKLADGALDVDISAGSWQFPGGHLEHGESFFACAERETLEETGLKVKGMRLIGVTNDVFEEAGKHYITLFVACRMEDPAATPKVSMPLRLDRLPDANISRGTRT